MKLPEDPFMLMSLINMKLRDGDYESLEHLCDDLGCSPQEIKAKLKEIGMEYNENLRRFG